MSAEDSRRALGTAIRQAVDRPPMLKKQVARDLGVTPAMLSNWFAGRTLPSAEKLQRIIEFAAARDVDVDASLTDLWQRCRGADGDGTGNGSTDEFAAFVGAEAAQRGMTLVYPEFAVHDGRLVPKAGAELHHDLAKFPSEFTGEALENFGPVVSGRDVGALGSVAAVLQRHRVYFDLAVDGAVAQTGAQHPLIAFGLESNAVTNLYLRSAASPLFSVTRTTEQRSGQVTLPTGRSFTSNQPIWRGLIARVTPRPDEASTRKWFFCAGVGATGTMAAANYLGSYWQRIHADVGVHDFVLIVSGHELSPATAQRDDLYIATPTS